MTSEARILNGKRVVSSINDIVKTVHSHSRQWNWISITHCSQKLNGNELKPVSPGHVKRFKECIGKKLHQTTQNYIKQKWNNQQNEKAIYDMEENIICIFIYIHAYMEFRKLNYKKKEITHYNGYITWIVIFSYKTCKWLE